MTRDRIKTACWLVIIAPIVALLTWIFHYFTISSIISVIVCCIGIFAGAVLCVLALLLLTKSIMLGMSIFYCVGYGAKHGEWMGVRHTYREFRCDLEEFIGVGLSDD